VTVDAIRKARGVSAGPDDEQPGRDLFEPADVPPAVPETPAAKVQLFTRLAQDPAIRAEVESITSPASAAVARLEHHGRAAREQRRERVARDNPDVQYLDSERALLDIAAALATFDRVVRGLWPRLRAMPPAEIAESVGARAVADHLPAVAADVQAIGDYLTTGASDIDRFLQDVLRGGE